MAARSLCTSFILHLWMKKKVRYLLSILATVVSSGTWMIFLVLLIEQQCSFKGQGEQQDPLEEGKHC